tara:strand:- start:88 stop:567 length:480 start_codon:yes stop_codon:yes gene_type:complete
MWRRTAARLWGDTDTRGAEECGEEIAEEERGEGKGTTLRMGSKGLQPQPQPQSQPHNHNHITTTTATCTESTASCCCCCGCPTPDGGWRAPLPSTPDEKSAMDRTRASNQSATLASRITTYLHTKEKKGEKGRKGGREGKERREGREGEWCVCERERLL